MRNFVYFKDLLFKIQTILNNIFLKNGSPKNYISRNCARLYRPDDARGSRDKVPGA